MTDVEKIVWGALGAIAVYIVGQLLSKFFIEPLHELRKAVGEVRFNLAFHAPHDSHTDWPYTGKVDRRARSVDEKFL